MKEIAEKFQKFGVVPVVVLEDTKDAVPLAKALVEGGLSVSWQSSSRKCLWEQVPYLQQNR